jgi:hypothetical protein
MRAQSEAFGEFSTPQRGRPRAPAHCRIFPACDRCAPPPHHYGCRRQYHHAYPRKCIYAYLCNLCAHTAHVKAPSTAVLAQVLRAAPLLAAAGGGRAGGGGGGPRRRHGHVPPRPAGPAAEMCAPASTIGGLAVRRQSRLPPVPIPPPPPPPVSPLMSSSRSVPSGSISEACRWTSDSHPRAGLGLLLELGGDGPGRALGRLYGSLFHALAEPPLRPAAAALLLRVTAGCAARACASETENGPAGARAHGPAGARARVSAHGPAGARAAVSESARWGSARWPGRARGGAGARGCAGSSGWRASLVMRAEARGMVRPQLPSGAESWPAPQTPQLAPKAAPHHCLSTAPHTTACGCAESCSVGTGPGGAAVMCAITRGGVWRKR